MDLAKLQDAKDTQLVLGDRELSLLVPHIMSLSKFWNKIAQGPLPHPPVLRRRGGHRHQAGGTSLGVGAGVVRGRARRRQEQGEGQGEDEGEAQEGHLVAAMA